MPNLSKALTRVLLLALFAFQISLDSPNVFAKPSEEKKTAQPVQAQSPKYAEKQLPLLTMDQIASLEFSQAVKYVKAFRKSFVDIESAQFMFRNSKFTSAMLLPEPSSEDQKLFAMIIGKYAFAEEDTQKRGVDARDKCIYAYHLSKYPNEGYRQPFLCVSPPGASCTSFKNAGTRCNFEISGLPANDPSSCISNRHSYEATRLCEAYRVKLSKKNATVISQKIEAAKKYFKIDAGAGATILKSALEAEEAKTHLGELLDNSYDDASYATLIKVLALYKKANIKEIDYITQSGNSADKENHAQSKRDFIAKIYLKVNLQNFEKNVNAANDVVDGIFENIVNHCDSPLDQQEVSKIKDANWQKTVKEHNSAALSKRERDRKRLLQEVQSKGETATVKNVLEKDECDRALQRLSSLKGQFNRSASTLPNIPGADKPVGAVPPSNNPQSPPVVVDKPAPKNGVITEAIGCSSNVAMEEDMVIDPYARCMICTSERDMAASADNEANEAAKDYKKNYSTSRKWHSLVSTMTMACGQGRQDKFLFHKRALFEMAFGHCSNSKYEWDELNGMSPEEKRNIQKWNNNSAWDEKNTMPGDALDSLNDAFEKTYGISYSYASEFFCHVGVSNRFWVGRVNGVEAEKAENAAENTSDFITKARENMKNNFNPNFFKRLIRTKVDDNLKNCMRESLANAEELYNNETNYCTSIDSFKDKASPNLRSMFSSLYNQPLNEADSDKPVTRRGGIIVNGSDCSVAKQIDTNYVDNKMASQRIAYVSTTKLSNDKYDGTSVTSYSDYINDPNVNIVAIPNTREKSDCLAISKNPKDCYFPDSSMDLRGNALNMLNFTYPSKSMCPPRNTAAAKRTSPGGGSTK